MEVRLINRSITNHLIDLAFIEFIIVASKNRVEWLSPFSRRVPLIKKLSKHDFRAGKAREYLQSERISLCGSWRFYSKVELLNYLFLVNEKRSSDRSQMDRFVCFGKYKLLKFYCESFDKPSSNDSWDVFDISYN